MGPDAPALFVAVDAIPFDVAAEVHAEGGLPGFLAPTPMVSVFPSLTTVALPALLAGAIDVRPPGYEARYFHRPSGEIRGSWDEEPGFAPYRRRAHGAFGHLAVYLLRAGLVWEEARWIGAQFAERQGPWLGYIAATDGVAHFGGRSDLLGAFRGVCKQLVGVCDRFEAAHGVRPRVVLCSDHGVEFGLTDHLDSAELAHLLAVSGCRAHLAPVGAVGAAAVWCDAGEARRVAQVAAEARGVELAIARTGDSCVVFRVSRQGLERGRISWEERRYRYEPLDGDPLELGSLEGDDETLFRHTWNHSFPDPLHRIRRGLTELVTWPAPVLVSMRHGWTTGPAFTHAVARAMGGQVGTHGALRRAQTLGFVCWGGPEMDDFAARPAVRAEHVFEPFKHAVRAGRA